MNNIKTKNVLFGIILICAFIAIILMLMFNAEVYAYAYTTDEQSHVNTLRDVQSNALPKITILTPSAGIVYGNDSYGAAQIFEWSNSDGYNDLTYREKSILEEVRRATDGVMFTFDKNGVRYYYDKNDYGYGADWVNGNLQKLNNKHWIALYEPWDFGTYQESYAYFHTAIDKLIEKYMELNNNYIPKINLVGHEMSGLINMQYSIDHPNNVSSLISTGTPYNGSELTQAINDYDSSLIQYIPELDIIKKAGMMNVPTALKNAWNSITNNSIKFYPIASTVSADYMADAVDAGLLDAFLPMQYKQDIVDCIREGDLSSKIDNLLKLFPKERDLIKK